MGRVRALVTKSTFKHPAVAGLHQLQATSAGKCGSGTGEPGCSRGGCLIPLVWPSKCFQHWAMGASKGPLGQRCGSPGSPQSVWLQP